MGANWVQGLGNPGGPQNPIWTLVGVDLILFVIWAIGLNPIDRIGPEVSFEDSLLQL
jgi:hypothetical protein